MAERANSTLVEMARNMLVHADLAESFWAEAINTAAYLRNRSETSTLTDMTPYESWNGKRPGVSHLRIFGSRAIILNKTHSKKFQPKGEERVLIGYSATAKAYRLFGPKTRKETKARDVIFLEDSPTDGSVRDQGSTNSTEVTLVMDESNSACNKDDNVEDVSLNGMNHYEQKQEAKIGEGDLEVDTADDCGKRGSGRPKLIYTGQPGRPRKQYNILNVMTTDDISVPGTMDAALNSPHAKFWQASMQKEIASLQANKTWTLTNLPKGEKVADGCSPSSVTKMARWINSSPVQ